MKRVFPTIAAFITALGLTLLTWHHARLNADLRDWERFERVGNTVADAISDRMSAYRSMLEQTRSVFYLNESISPGQWHTYVESLRLDDRYPGAQGLGFAQAIREHDMGRATARLRSRPGERSFKIWPEGKRDLYVPITLLEPRDWRNERAIGFDMYSEPARRAAMDAAIESGQARMTDLVTLAQETNVDPQPGFLIYTPIFKLGLPIATPAERQAALIGFVYAPFRAHDLFNEINSDISLITDTRSVDYEIFLDTGDPHPSQALFDRDGIPRTGDESATFLRSRAIALPVGGQVLQLRIYSLDGFQKRGDALLPPAILLFGLALTALLTRLFWSNTRQSDRLGKSERQLRLVTDTLPAVVGYVDPNGKLQFVNRMFDDWFAAEGRTALGRPAREVLGERNFAQIEPGLRDAIQGRSAQIECEFKLPRGDILACDARFIPDFGPRSRVKGVVTLISDLTETRRAEARAQLLLAATTVLHGSLESERMAARFASSLVPGFADWMSVDLMDEDGRPRRISGLHRDPDLTPIFLQDDPAVQPFGADSSDPVGDLIRDRETLFLPRVSEAMIDSVEPPERRACLKRIGPGSIIGIPLSTREKGLGMLFFGRCPESKPFDESDFQFALDIGRRATLAIENLRLFRDIQAANRAKDEFLATVSHELRTPMNVILGWVEILRGEKHSPAEFDSILRTVERNAKVQIELINELLDISRIVSGKLALQLKSLRIEDAVSLAVESVWPAAKAKNIALERRVAGDAPFIAVDPDRLHQVLWNLLNNAVKFTPAGGRIDVVVSAAAGGVTIQVKDTGQGIEPRFLPYVFDRFRQEESGVNRHHGGLGIGLALVRYLIELHGGYVHAESGGRNQGAMFTVFLPATETAPQPEPKQVQRPFHDAKTARPDWAVDERALTDLDILLVDDSPDVRALLERILVKAGAAVRTASAAPEALAIFRKGVFDVILSDIGLPEVDGYELMKQIREIEQRRGGGRTPAAALTAYAADKDARRALEAGYDLHIAKPVAVQDLIETVQRLARSGPEPEGGVRHIQGV